MKISKPIKGILVFAMAAAAVAVAPLTSLADKAKKVTIIHKGKEITVSCNALDGHKKHADAVEARSIRRAQRLCARESD